MKRDMTLIRDLLLAIEKSPRVYQLENYEQEKIRYHEALLIEAGLVDGSISNELANCSEAPSHVIISKLTWDGHEFIDNIRQDDVWITLKNEFKDASFSTVFNVGKQLTEGYAKKKVEAILGL